MVESEAVRRVRSFNRTVTQRIGALHDEYLARGRPLGASRVLWELGDAGTPIRELRARLGLDSGYLSRLLRLLEQEGLVTIETSPHDRRIRTVHPTSAGRVEQDLLDRQSDSLAASLLSPLTSPQRARLVESMAAVERLLTAGLVEVAIADPTTTAAQTCLQAYVDELNHRFTSGFDPDRSISASPEDMTEPAGLLLVAWLREQPIGCGALKLHGTDPAEIKRMWVAPDARGLGVGRRILAELETHADQRGVRVLRLETNNTLTEAISLYRSAGYEEVAPFNDEPYAHHWFQKHLASESDATSSVSD